MPNRDATERVGRPWMLLPSSRTVPDAGVSRRARARNSVDLPHALAPTMTVMRPSGMATERSSATRRSPYARVTPSATSGESDAGTDGATGAVTTGASPAEVGVMSASSADAVGPSDEPEQVRGTDDPGDDPDG